LLAQSTLVAVVVVVELLGVVEQEVSELQHHLVFPHKHTV
jgi:hypothetical protein